MVVDRIVLAGHMQLPTRKGNAITMMCTVSDQCSHQLRVLHRVIYHDGVDLHICMHAANALMMRNPYMHAA